MSLDTAGTYRYPSPDTQWLARRTEDILDPGLPIIDAHHHLWIEDGVPYLGAEIMDDLASGHRIEATVFVQAHYGYRQDGPTEMAPVGETEKVAAISATAMVVTLITFTGVRGRSFPSVGVASIFLMTS